MVLDLERAKKIYDDLFSDVKGRDLSLKWREEREIKSKSFVYGEVVPDGFYQMMSEADVRPGQVFYDLGSGTGKAIILAHLLFDFPQAIGIELVDSLYDASIQVQNRYEKEFRPSIAKEVGDRKISFVHASILDVDMSDADFVFMNSTCFEDDLVEAIAEKLECLRPNVTVISLSKSLPPTSFHAYKSKKYDFSWGQATAFFHRKRLWKVYG